MKPRIELQKKLEEFLGSRNVYYQPPENLKMEYPCIRYSKTNIQSNYANDKKYRNMNRYDVIIISNTPDLNVVDNLLDMEYSSYERHYVTDNLYHDVISIYF